jgi:hypothetical protein
MTDAERELLLIVARWVLSQEILVFDEADSLDSDTKVKEAKDLAHHVRGLIAKVEAPKPPGPPG